MRERERNLFRPCELKLQPQRMPTWVRAKWTVSCRLGRARLGAFATKHALLQPQRSAKLLVPAFASGAMHFCSSQKTAGAEVQLQKRAQERSGADCFVFFFLKKNRGKRGERTLYYRFYCHIPKTHLEKTGQTLQKPQFPECFSNNSSFPVKLSNLLSPVWEAHAGDKL